METHLEEIREQQKETWNKSAAGWKKWDTLSMDFLKPLGDEIIRLIKPRGKDRILDVAAGTGEPGLTIARMLKGGMVISADLSKEMLEIAREKAKKKGVNNFETKVCDASELPFADNSFDAISCRLGFMFFPDMLLAAKEMVRVLKPGGRIAAAVWNGPEKNFWITATMNTINNNLQLPGPTPGTPGIFRAAGKGLMSEIFIQAGLKNIKETEVNGKLNAGTVDVYWNFMTDSVAPVVNALSQADEAMRSKIKNEVYESVNRKYPDGRIAIDSNALVIYGDK